jgi:hypothetical protein
MIDFLGYINIYSYLCTEFKNKNKKIKTMKRYTYTSSLTTTDKKWADEGGICITEILLI